MRLNAKILKNVANINQFEYANQAYIQEGQANEFYLQLVDLDKLPSGSSECPLRYIPQGTSIALTVIFPSLDADTNEIQKIASQPFSGDLSIWKVSLSSSELPSSGNIRIKLTIDSSDKYFIVSNAIVVDMLEVGSC